MVTMKSDNLLVILQHLDKELIASCMVGGGESTAVDL